MKTLFFIPCFLLVATLYAQQTITKKFLATHKEIEINTEGLDEIRIENSKDNVIAIFLYDEKTNAHNVIIKEENKLHKISFLLMVKPTEEVFRKFITKRANRAVAKIIIPKNKQLTLLGKEIDIISKNYYGDILIFIDKGKLQLNQVQQNANINLYAGNVFASVYQSEINITSNLGTLIVDKEVHQKKFKKTQKEAIKKFRINSIKANVVLNTQKTQ